MDHFTVYKQYWSNGKSSYHRNPMDIGEFHANQQDLTLKREGSYVVLRNSDFTAFERVKDNVGVWGLV